MYLCFNYRSINLSQVNIYKSNSKRNFVVFVLDPIENLKKLELTEIENLESKLDEIIDRLLSIRSELIARQFENDLQSNIPCRLQ